MPRSREDSRSGFGQTTIKFKWNGIHHYPKHHVEKVHYTISRDLQVIQICKTGDFYTQPVRILFSIKVTGDYDCPECVIHLRVNEPYYKQALAAIIERSHRRYQQFKREGIKTTDQLNTFYDGLIRLENQLASL